MPGVAWVSFMILGSRPREKWPHLPAVAIAKVQAENDCLEPSLTACSSRVLQGSASLFIFLCGAIGVGFAVILFLAVSQISLKVHFLRGRDCARRHSTARR